PGGRVRPPARYLLRPRRHGPVATRPPLRRDPAAAGRAARRPPEARLGARACTSPADTTPSSASPQNPAPSTWLPDLARKRAAGQTATTASGSADTKEV